MRAATFQSGRFRFGFLRFDLFRFNHWSLIWRDFWRKLAPECGRADCVHRRSFWRRMRASRQRVLVQGSRYCREGCLHRALGEAFERLRAASPRASAPHRVPLGLLLLARRQLTEQQLRAALEAQHTAGRGRIGEWLQALGFASEQQVTSALARQWGCPVWHAASVTAGTRTPQIPAALLESFVMMPVDYVAATRTLHVAFGEGIDYSVLYAIGQMADCRTEPCMAAASKVRGHLESLSGPRAENEMVFDRLTDDAECARIIASYSTGAGAYEVRIAACGPYVWVRLLPLSRIPLDLLFRTPRRLSVLPPAPAPLALPGPSIAV
jgi:hypothetical protein